LLSSIMVRNTPTSVEGIHKSRAVEFFGSETVPNIAGSALEDVSSGQLQW